MGYLPAFFADPFDTFPSFFKSILPRQPSISPEASSEKDIHPNPFFAFFVLDVQLENTVGLSI
jgi:hypothetical protein